MILPVLYPIFVISVLVMNGHTELKPIMDYGSPDGSILAGVTDVSIEAGLMHRASLELRHAAPWSAESVMSSGGCGRGCTQGGGGGRDQGQYSNRGQVSILRLILVLILVLVLVLILNLDSDPEPEPGLRS